MKQQIIALSTGFFQKHFVLSVVKAGVRQDKIRNTFNMERTDVSNSGNV